MAENNPFDDSAERRRRVEALFADEPYLSPTMRARRLNEQLPRTEVDWTAPPAPPAPPKAAAQRPALRVEPSTPPLPEPPPASPEERISLVDARARFKWLRSGAAGFAALPGHPQAREAARLQHFKAKTLDRWIREMYQ